VGGLELGVQIRPLCFFGEKPMPTSRQLSYEFAPVVDDLPFEVFPIVEAGATQVVVVDAEAERTAQPELGADGYAGAADAACVVGNLGLMEDDVQPRFVFRVRFGHS